MSMFILWIHIYVNQGVIMNACNILSQFMYLHMEPTLKIDQIIPSIL